MEPTHSIPTVGTNGDMDAQRKKLILCFDGTSNQFQGDGSDTNVVKLYQMLDRKNKHQYHYYQPGIGTYRANSVLQNSPSTGLLAKVYSWCRATADDAFASSFAEHVMAGYKFLMRYYMEGDKVYIFGFSRGAYTARFLCELISEVGLLSKGNEEMIPFIWYQYVHYRSCSDGASCKDMIEKMRQTFCRPKVKVFWLGLWDCVSSIAELPKLGGGRNAPSINEANPNIAMHVRHAISCHERRVKFRPTLFNAETNTWGSLEEQWFAGNHGDVGGGWNPKQTEDMLLSDFALVWMVRELMREELDEDLPLSWRTAKGGEFEKTFEAREKHLQDNMKRLRDGSIHKPDMLWHDVLHYHRAGPGLVKLVKTPLWWLLECLPLKHWILTTSGRWKTTSMPNRGHRRDIPSDAKFHDSVEQLYKAGVFPQMPRRNNSDLTLTVERTVYPKGTSDRERG